MDESPEIAVPSLDTETIISVLEDEPITLAVLYGSHARGESTTHSDVDLAVAVSESLSALDRTRVRLRLLKKLSRALGTDAVDVVRLAETSPSLRRDIQADGIVLYGSTDAWPPIADEQEYQTHSDRMARFDELLTDIEQVV